MPDENRSYRQNMASHGLVFLAGEELDIKIKNLSITGMLTVLEENDIIKEVKDVFDAIKFCPNVDFYLPEMRLEGEAGLVRVDLINGVIHLAFEFINLSYDVGNMLYKRKAYRKNMTAPGQIVFFGEKYHFVTKNVSLDGLMIYLEKKIDVEPGTKTIFDFKRLKLQGVVKVVWVEYIDEGGMLMGLHYEQVEKKHLHKIPRFNPDFSFLK